MRTNPMLRFRAIFLFALPVLFLLGIAWLGRVIPGVPIVAILVGVLLFVAGVRLLRSAGTTPPAYEGPPEDVSGLDVYFVCVECRTELHVEKLGELQVPRHCGEKMVVERRPRPAPQLN